MKQLLSLNDAIRIATAIERLDSPAIATALKPSNRAAFRLAKNRARLEGIIEIARKTLRAEDAKLRELARTEGRSELTPEENEKLKQLNTDLGLETEEVDLIAIPLSEFSGAGGVPGVIQALTELDGVIIEDAPETAQ
jgi:hypothetical protein